MKILYCRVGWMNAYQGNSDEKPVGGGRYNKDNIGHEVYNYLGVNDRYYGFVQAGKKEQIHIERLCKDDKAEFVNDVLVVWVAKKATGGQWIVGWYKKATVYRFLQQVPEEVRETRELKDHCAYNITSIDVYLLEESERKYKIEGMGQANVWYGNPEIDRKVVDYINHYENAYDERIAVIDAQTKQFEGEEQEVIVKTRINQDKFRTGLIKKFGCRCCLCGVNFDKLLVASHIKPWAKSDKHEKLDMNNGLLLCPNHDKLFDSGLISFEDDGTIIISDMLDETNRIFMNVDEKMRIKVTADSKGYLKYHREKVLKKDM